MIALPVALIWVLRILPPTPTPPPWVARARLHHVALLLTGTQAASEPGPETGPGALDSKKLVDYASALMINSDEKLNVPGK
jgi:hypothetical protein